MSLFLLIFLGIYGAMHAYAFIRLRSAFSHRPAIMSLLPVLMLLMTFTPLLVRLAEHAGLEFIALCLAWPGYIWMGALLIFTTALLALDAMRVLAWLRQHFTGVAMPGFLTPAITCELALMLAAVASIYACYEARRIRTEHVTVSTAKLPAASGKIRIVQISDVHVGLLFRESRLAGLLSAIREARPDILVSTGDLVDGRLSREDIIKKQEKLAAMLASIPTPGGKFAITGNHEFYAGLDQALTFTRMAGFTVLRNQSTTLPSSITITGIDDKVASRFGLADPIVQEPGIVGAAPAGSFHLLLKHRPEVQPASDGHFDLQLSGHVHKGQIFPFYLLVKFQFPIPCGTSKTKAGSLIHVSRGSGTWGPPMRLFASPEITVIDIVPAERENPDLLCLWSTNI